MIPKAANLCRREFVRAGTMAIFSLATGRACAAQEQEGSRSRRSLFDGKTLDGWIQVETSSTKLSATPGWIVKDGVMASTGSGRGVIYTAQDYTNYRLIYDVRHVSGYPDHQAGVLFFCKRPDQDGAPLDALGGIQFQLPMGSYWDYRPGNNNSGSQFFNTIMKSPFDRHAWSRVELLVDAGKGTARLAVAQPPGSKAIELVDFRDPLAGRSGPVAFQMHNAGLFDEYKNISIEVDPVIDDLLSTRQD